MSSAVDCIEYTDEFLAPIPDVLLKAEEENGKRILYMEASNQSRDDQNETILQKALQDSVDYFMRRGVISWDHLHKLKGDPSYIIGEPLDVRFTEDGRTLVKSELYSKNQIANGVWENAQSRARRLGSSVGGGILKKSDQGYITRVIWDEVALSHKPVNSGTYETVSVIPYQEFMKALMAGAGVNPENFSGGRALTRESLQGSVVFHNALVKMGRTRSGNLIHDVGTQIKKKGLRLDNLHEPDARVFVVGVVRKSAPDLTKEESLAVADGLIDGLRA